MAGETASPEAVAPENASGPSPKEAGDAKKTADALAEKTQEAEELRQRLLRLQADFENFRRRTRQEKEELSRIITCSVTKELLPVLDNFERALAAPAQDAAGLLAGVEMVYRQLAGVLEKFGVRAVAAVGQQFDPACHEAVVRVEDPAQPDGLIVEELQKGYEAGGKVLRPSLVKVISNN